MSIKNILFDLDGTLLPMVQDEFVRFYMPLLAKAYISAGIKVEPKSFISSVWKGYEAMVRTTAAGRIGRRSGALWKRAFRLRLKSQRRWR